MSETSGNKLYDMVIIGAGPAGMTAALYASRANMSVLMVEKGVVGGQIATTNDIENYPGFDRITGPDLSERMEQQARHFGAELTTATIETLRVDGEIKEVVADDGTVFRGRTIVIASGSEPRKLGVPGEEKLSGLGVSYCATCDGAFFKGADVAVVGGGDSALQEGLFLTRYVRKLYIIHRRDRLRAQHALAERARRNEKVEFIWDSTVEEILGESEVEAVRIRNVKTGETRELKVQGVFPYIGLTPNSSFVPGSIKMDAEGKILTDERMATSVPGVFAAGDIRPNVRQLTTAVNDGSIAAMAAEAYLAEME